MFSTCRLGSQWSDLKCKDYACAARSRAKILLQTSQVRTSAGSWSRSGPLLFPPFRPRVGCYSTSFTVYHVQWCTLLATDLALGNHFPQNRLLVFFFLQSSPFCTHQTPRGLVLPSSSFRSLFYRFLTIPTIFSDYMRQLGCRRTLRSTTPFDGQVPKSAKSAHCPVPMRPTP